MRVNIGGEDVTGNVKIESMKRKSALKIWDEIHEADKRMKDVMSIPQPEPRDFDPPMNMTGDNPVSYFTSRRMS